MKIHAIKRSDNKDLLIGYLFYYEKAKEFYIELLDNLSEWDIPLLLSSLYKKDIKTINPYYSMIWVKHRIVPADRQNIGQILKDNGLKYYDEYELLMLANGKCEQDNYYLSKSIDINNIKEINKRFERRIIDIVLLENKNVLVFFKNGEIRLFDLDNYILNNNKFKVINEQNYKYLKIRTGGYGIYWDDFLEIMDYTLYEYSKEVNLTNDILISYIHNNILITEQVMEELDCSRQYVNQLVKSKKLNPVKASNKNTLYLRSEVLKNKWI